MNKINKELISPTAEPAGEEVHRLTRAALAAVPAFGGPLVEVFNALIEPPMARRKTEWMIQVTEILNQLFEKDILTQEDLQTNELFFSTLVRASSIAIRNHEKEKLDALRNAVLNSALPDAPDVTRQQLFMNLIDSFTPRHLALLRLFQGPQQWAQDNGHQFPKMSVGGLTDIIESAFPELTRHQDLYQLIWQELFRNRLVNTENLGTTMSFNGMLAKRTTAMGDQFVAFISSPFTHN